MRYIVILLLSLSSSFCINNDIYQIAKFLNNKSFKISGEFFYYDFLNVPSHWDYVFKPINTSIYLQLRGNNPQINDVFGWKKTDIDIVTLSDYYFVYIGDFDLDNDSRFDWLLIRKKNKKAYKLVGSSIDDTFKWSSPLPVTFDIKHPSIIFVADDIVSIESIFVDKEPSNDYLSTSNKYKKDSSQISNPPLFPAESTTSIDNSDKLTLPPSVPSTNLELPPSF
jgi:hypothetical protein